MIIDKTGKAFWTWDSSIGPLVEDRDNRYNLLFKIGLYYNETQREQHSRIAKLKYNLAQTDWRAAKYADGGYTEEEYAPYKAQRAAWRAEINEIEEDFHEPSITREEMDEAERMYIEKYRFEQPDPAPLTSINQ